MKLNYTHIIFVIDSSGSMNERRADVIGGFNTLLKDQQEAEGEATMSLYTFSDYVQRSGGQREKLRHFPALNLHSYQPRGRTALLDAIGTALAKEGACLAALPEEHRPGLVQLVIMTDGEESSSREFSLERVKEMLAEQQEKYGWVVSYLGVGLDAFRAATRFGLDSAHVAHVGASGQEAMSSYASSSQSITRSRTMRAAGGTDEEVKTSGGFTSEEREKMLVDPAASRIDVP